MKITKKALSAVALTASAVVGMIALAEHSVVAQDAIPRTNTAKPGEVWTTQPQSKVVPDTRSTELRMMMQRLNTSEQKVFTRAINKLTPEERRVLAKALNAPASSGSTDLTPPTPPVPPSSPLNPATSSRTGQGSSGVGTLPP